MELMVFDPTYVNEDDKKAREKFLNNLSTEMAHFSNEFSLKDADAGHGADWPTILVTFGGIFILGKQINDAIDGWIGISKKLVNLLKKIQKKFGNCLIDSDAASMIAIERIAKKYKGEITSIKKLTDLTIPMCPCNNRGSIFRRSPLSHYLKSYQINGDMVFIFLIKSNCAIEFEKEIAVNDWHNF